MTTYYLEITQTMEDIDSVPNHFNKKVANRDEALTLLDVEKVHFQGLRYQAKFITENHDNENPCEEEIIEQVTQP